MRKCSFEKKSSIRGYCWWLDILTLISVYQYVAFRFLQSTTFPFVYSDLYKTITLLSLIIFGGARFFNISYDKLKKMENKGTRTKWFMLVALSGCIAFPFIYVGWKNSLKILIFMPITALCLYEMDSRKVVKGFVYTIGALLCATVVCCLAGSINNYGIVGERRNESFVAAYGICNTTDLAAYCLFLLLFAWCSHETNRCSAGIWALISVLVGVGTHYITGSQTTLICCILVAVACVWHEFEKYLGKKETCLWIRKSVDIITIISLPIFAIVFWLLVVLYGEGLGWTSTVNASLSNRLQDTWNIVQKYGVSLFGTAYEMHGNGGSILHDYRVYDFLDSSYAFLLVRYGIVISLIFFSLWIWMTIRAIRAGNRKIALIMAIMAVFAISESHLQEINFNILVAMPFCTFNTIKEKEANNQEKKIVHLIPAITAIGIIGCIILIMPRLLSWLRSLVYLQKWNSGLNTLWLLLLCISWIALLLLLWKSICWLCYKKDKRIAIPIFCIMLLLSCSLIISNGVIQKGIQENLSGNEENNILLVQSSASQPVYAAEKSEIYHQTIGGFKDTIMTPEDLCRKKQGTIITDINREVLPIIQAGGQYLQLTDTSGIYSFDPMVIDTLTAAGFEWKHFYYSERSFDLEELAYINGLTITSNGQLIIEQGRSISENRFLDQLAGEYEVRCRLSLPAGVFYSQDVLLCKIAVDAFKGEVNLYERDVYLSEFRNDNMCEIRFTYEWDYNMPKTEYLIEVVDGITLYVDEIAWKRVS